MCTVGRGPMADEPAPLRPERDDPLSRATPPTQDVEARRARSAIEAALFGDTPIAFMTIGGQSLVFHSRSGNSSLDGVLL